MGLQIHGLTELRAALLKLPPDLVREAGVIVHAQAEAMAHAVQSQYPVKTGNLRNHVQVELASDGVSATARVKNTARTKDGTRDLGQRRRRVGKASSGLCQARQRVASDAREYQGYDPELHCFRSIPRSAVAGEQPARGAPAGSSRPAARRPRQVLATPRASRA